MSGCAARSPGYVPLVSFLMGSEALQLRDTAIMFLLRNNGDNAIT